MNASSHRCPAADQGFRDACDGLGLHAISKLPGESSEENERVRYGDLVVTSGSKRTRVRSGSTLTRAPS